MNRKTLSCLPACVFSPAFRLALFIPWRVGDVVSDRRSEITTVVVVTRARVRGDDGARAVGATDDVMMRPPRRRRQAGERSEVRGHRTKIEKSAALSVGALALARAAIRPLVRKACR